jgi:heme/copper-type cytochrome/quinol oxidase subunit 1
MTAIPPPVPRRGRAVHVVIPALAVLGLVLLGAAAWFESRPAPGWFAYAPLSDTTYVPGGASAPGAAVLLSGAGALLIGGAVGFVVGRRSRPAADEL